MSETPVISFVASSNRPELWHDAYNNVKDSAGDVEFEYIFVGPNPPVSNLPSNAKHIQTSNVKVPQCFEIGIRNATGGLLSIQADDTKFEGGGISKLYGRYLEICEEQGHNNVVILPGFRDRRTASTLRYNKIRNAPLASLNSALVGRELLAKVGGMDKRFIGVYWDCDMAMSLQNMGVHFEKYDEVFSVEFRPKVMPYRLHRICKPYDRSVLDSFWTRFTDAPEPTLPDDAYCYMGDRRWVVTKNRQKDVTPFNDEDILLKTQGVKEAGDLKWE